MSLAQATCSERINILTPNPSDPLLMNAFNDVNIAGACILTSTECAEQMGISRDKWIFPLGGGRAEDSIDCIAYPFQIVQLETITN